MAEVKTMPRLKKLYNAEIAKTFKKELGLENINQVPKLEKLLFLAVLVKNAKIKDLPKLSNLH